MASRISAPVRATQRHDSASFSVRGIDVHAAATTRSPVVFLDEFRVTGSPFPPHPHAGFSAVTYVFPDSASGLRCRDSLGNDVQVGPGGIVWTEAGSGVLHHELPAQPDRTLHGLQVFVNSSAGNKLRPPRLLQLDGRDVPDWTGGAGDRARVVVGSFGGVSSPLLPTEPFTFLDIDLRSTVSIPVTEGLLAVVHVLAGELALHVGDGGGATPLREGEAVVVEGGDGVLSVRARGSARLLVLIGQTIRDPVVVQGPFIMNGPEQIDDAVARYRSGGMGRLELLSRQ